LLSSSSDLSLSRAAAAGGIETRKDVRMHGTLHGKREERRERDARPARSAAHEGEEAVRLEREIEGERDDERLRS